MHAAVVVAAAAAASSASASKFNARIELPISTFQPGPRQG